MLTNGVQRQLLSYIDAGRRELSLPLALKLESFFNLPEGKLLKMQAENNVQNYKRQLKNELADQLLRANAFWSYANVSAKNIPDEELIEKWQKWRALSRIFLRAGLLLQHKLGTKYIVMMLLSERFMSDENFEQLEPKYKVTKGEIREYILQKLKNSALVNRRQVSPFFTCCWLCGGLV